MEIQNSRVVDVVVSASNSGEYACIVIKSIRDEHELLAGARFVMAD